MLKILSLETNQLIFKKKKTNEIQSTSQSLTSVTLLLCLINHDVWHEEDMGFWEPKRILKAFILLFVGCGIDQMEMVNLE